jgi:hypothetical protein
MNEYDLPPAEDLVRGECPCDNCDKYDFCKYQEMACRSFGRFVFNNSYFINSARHPTKGMYNKIFNGSDERELRILLKQMDDITEKLNEDSTKSNEGE